MTGAVFASAQQPAAAGPTDLLEQAECLAAKPGFQFAWLIGLAFACRFAMFGSTWYFDDELFYFHVGLRMHEGALPYVDIWDRKGPGLFLTYYLIGFLGRSVLTYQIVATAFAAATSIVIARIARLFGGAVPAVLSGTIYLLAIGLYGGGGGQSPVLYNLWMALAAWAVVALLRKLTDARLDPVIVLAMFGAGFALTYKQTAMFEGAFFGLFVLWSRSRAGVPPRTLARDAVLLTLAGAAPMLVAAIGYAAIGHFTEFWDAMVISNLTRQYDVQGDNLARINVLLVPLLPLLGLALAGSVSRSRPNEAPRVFFIGWIVAGAMGVIVIPNFYEHYVLPLLIPLSVCAARAMARWRTALAAGIVAVLFYGLISPGWAFDQRARSRSEMARLASDIAARDAHPRLFIYEGPIDLYRQFRIAPPTPLVDPLHLFFPPENGTSPYDAATEVSRVLAWRPDAVTTYRDPGIENAQTAPLVHGYIAGHCRYWGSYALIGPYQTQWLDLWGDCANPLKSKA